MGNGLYMPHHRHLGGGFGPCQVIRPGANQSTTTLLSLKTRKDMGEHDTPAQIQAPDGTDTMHNTSESLERREHS
jgi:hypothetical protein